MSIYIARQRLEPNKPISIIERDARGGVVGTYTGYWSSKRRSVTLYPDYRHPAYKPGVTLKKHTVFDGYVRVEAPAAEKKKVPEVRSQTAKAIRGLRDLPGQEAFKF